jgi:hypothetical protein
MLVGLMVLSSNAFGQFQTNAGSSSTATVPLQTNMSIIKLPEGAIDLKVPINILNNSSKVYWNSPSKISLENLFSDISVKRAIFGANYKFAL